MAALEPAASTMQMLVPDIGDFNDVPVIEVLVKAGDILKLEDPVVTLESEKATLDVPATAAGRVVSLAISPGSRVSKGTVLLILEPDIPAVSGIVLAPPIPASPAPKDSASAPPPGSRLVRPEPKEPVPAGSRLRIYAGPAVRRLGRELGVDMSGLQGSGRGGRLLAGDIQALVRGRMANPMSQAAGPNGPALQATPAVDYARFGDVEKISLSRIQKLSGATLARNWATIPHVTNFDEADITDLDCFRETLNAEKKPSDAKVSLLSFLMKACAVTLKKLPHFNASLEGESVVLKKYFHIGAAVDTPSGLVVPVVRHVDQLGIREIAAELSLKAESARAGKLKRPDMEGGCFTISSLGGIGGSGFTPIINAPEIAILGVGKARIMPRWNGTEFKPRLIVPLCLSWDHRALDGVAAARFLVLLVQLLEDFRRVVL